MQKQINASIFVVLAILMILIVCGSVWDLEIANEVYSGQLPSENIFGIVFSYIGIIPTFVGWSFLGASIIYLSKNQIENIKKRRFVKAFGILLCVLSFFYFCNTLYLANANAFEVHFLVAYAIGIATICVAAYLGYALSKRSKNGAEILKNALFLAAVSFVTLILISATKEIMCRPRFRYVLAMDDIAYFKTWWQSGRELKEGLDAGVVTDEFASLPSGHSAYSMFAIFIFPAFAHYIDALKKYQVHLFSLGFAWWIATAFSRMTLGAHYLSDVAIAGLIAIIAYALVCYAKRIYLKKKSK
jgi:membrane-associated phospholipid phosphatase